MAKEKTVTVTQPDDESFRHEGEVAVYGDCDKAPMKHDVAHYSSEERPLVHMICWEEQSACKVTVDGAVTLRGDDKAPVAVRMDHSFNTPHHQTHEVAPLDHALSVNTALAEPIHHALQMRTPLQLRFCNPWHIASDYQVEVRFGKNRLAAIRLTGATVASPQPCDEPCAEPDNALPDHP